MKINTKSEKTAKTGKLPVYDMQGKEIEEVDSVFSGRIAPAVISHAVTMYLANQRTGLAATKTRGEVSGGGKKPWKQKGTGRARAGSTRSPLWRHGGVVFGPHPRDFHYALPAKIRNRALYAVLSEKSVNDGIMVLESLKLSQPKSREIKRLLGILKVKEQATIVMGAPESGVQRASRNLPFLSVAMAKNLNALDVLKAKKIIFTKDALKIVEQRLARYNKK